MVHSSKTDGLNVGNIVGSNLEQMWEYIGDHEGNTLTHRARKIFGNTDGMKVSHTDGIILGLNVGNNVGLAVGQ